MTVNRKTDNQIIIEYLEKLDNKDKNTKTKPKPQSEIKSTDNGYNDLLIDKRLGILGG